MESLVSIIIPCYNASKTINHCLESLNKQIYTYWEAICIDDGSIDATKDLIEYKILSETRIRLYTQPNKGAAKAREIGVSHAKGDYILFLDADDTLTPDALDLMLNLFRQEPQTDIVVSGFNIIKDGILLKSKSPKWKKIDNISYLKRVLCGKDGWELCAKMYKKDLFSEEVHIAENLRIGEDAATFIQLVCRAKFVGGCHNSIYNYIQHNCSASHIKSAKYAEETIESALFIESFLQKTNLLNKLSLEVDVMFMLMYSNSTRKYRLGRKHPLVKKVREHMSVSALIKLPFYRIVYLIISYYWGTYIKYFSK